MIQLINAFWTWELQWARISCSQALFALTFGHHLTKISLTLGAFGNVKYAWLKDNPEARFAIKAMKKKEIIDSKHVDHIENEKKILEIIEHPFIVSTLYL